MKYIIILLLFPITAFSSDAWTTSDSVREATYLALHVADWGQTRYANSDENRHLYEEQNPILGKHPSIKRVDTYFAVTALLHVGVAYVLPRKWREAFQYTTIGGEAIVVFRNNSIGVRIDF